MANRVNMTLEEKEIATSAGLFFGLHLAMIGLKKKRRK